MQKTAWEIKIPQDVLFVLLLYELDEELWCVLCLVQTGIFIPQNFCFKF